MGYTIQIQNATTKWKSIQKAEELMYYLGIEFSPSCYIKGDRRDWLFRAFSKDEIEMRKLDDGFSLGFKRKHYSWLKRQRIKGLLEIFLLLGITPTELIVNNLIIWGFTKDINNTTHGITLKRL